MLGNFQCNNQSRIGKQYTYMLGNSQQRSRQAQASIRYASIFPITAKTSSSKHTLRDRFFNSGRTCFASYNVLVRVNYIQSDQFSNNCPSGLVSSNEQFKCCRIFISVVREASLTTRSYPWLYRTFQQQSDRLRNYRLFRANYGTVKSRARFQYKRLPLRIRC